MTNFFEKWRDENNERKRLYAQEKYILDISEKLWEQLEKQDISKTQLANRLGKSKSYVSQLLNGSRNMTIRTLADISFVLGVEPHTHFLLKDDEREWLQFGKVNVLQCGQANELFSVCSDSNNDWGEARRIRAKCA